jgi:hypothetical protein
MTLMEWAQVAGNLGEMVGAIAVVATLVFVGIQVRQSRIVMAENNSYARLESLDESRRSFSGWRCMLAANPELASLWRVGLAGEELDVDQRLRFRQLQSEYQYLFATAYDRFMVHGMPERAQAMADALALLIEQNPQMPEFTWQDPGTEEFNQEVEAARPGVREARARRSL